MNQQYPSILLEKAVGEFSKLPGIGRKTAMRLVLHLLRQDTATVEAFGNSIITLKREVKYCKVCHNISDTETCQICANPQRDASTVCVVENIRDVMAVEATQQYRGLYHVLGGVISPMDGNTNYIHPKPIAPPLCIYVYGYCPNLYPVLDPECQMPFPMYALDCHQR